MQAALLLTGKRSARRIGKGLDYSLIFLYPNIINTPNNIQIRCIRAVEPGNSHSSSLGEAMSLRVQVSIEIERPLAEVFHFYAEEHVRNHPKWDPDMQLEQVTDGPMGVGTIIRRRNTHSGTPVEGTMEVVEYEINRAMGVIIYDGPSETFGRVMFTASNPKRTTLTISAHFPEMDSSQKNWITGLVERSARNIKQLIESESR
jgi:hypothetical protein